MKHVIMFMFFSLSFFFFSCSEQFEENSIVSSHTSSKTALSVLGNGYPAYTTFASIPLKEWSYSGFSRGVTITAGNSMQEYDHVFALLDYGDRQKSDLICLQKIKDIHTLLISGEWIKNIEIFGIYNPWSDNGVYPYNYLQLFKGVGLVDWQNGGTTLKVVLEEWNDTFGNLFVELSNEKEKTLLFIGNPGTREFEVQIIGINGVTGIRAFATYKTFELPLDAN